jgi:hypothetical protein
MTACDYFQRCTDNGSAFFRAEDSGCGLPFMDFRPGVAKFDGGLCEATCEIQLIHKFGIPLDDVTLFIHLIRLSVLLIGRRAVRTAVRNFLKASNCASSKSFTVFCHLMARLVQGYAF